MNIKVNLLVIREKISDLIKNSYFLKNILMHVKPIAKKRNRKILDNYSEISFQEASALWKALSSSWQDPSIPKLQDENLGDLIAEYSKGRSVAAFDSLVDIISNNVSNLNNKTILEVGCSSGYYSEVLKIGGVSSKYSGCDYSEQFINCARSRYPLLQWDVENATSLSYSDKTFNIVISGCCLLHIFDYVAAITEAARVAKDYVVFHCTPVLQKGNTTYYKKKAYNIDMLEIHFNEREFVEIIEENGLMLKDVRVINLFPFWKGNDNFSIKTYIFSCERQ